MTFRERVARRRKEQNRNLKKAAICAALVGIAAISIGMASRQAADNKAGIEYEQFNRTQKIISDFDREVKRLLDGDKPDSGKSRK